MFVFLAPQPTVAQIIPSVRNLGGLISSMICNYAEIARRNVELTHSWEVIGI